MRIQTKIISVFVLLFIIVFAAYAFPTGLREIQALTQLTDQSILDINELKFETVVLALHTNKSQVISLSAEPDIYNFIKYANTSRSAGLLTEIRDHIDISISLNPDIEEVYILNAKGILVFSSKNISLGSDMSSDPVFVKGLKSASINIVQLTNVLDTPTYTISVPIRDPVNDLSLGVLVYRYKTTEINAIIGNRTGLGLSGESFILDFNKLPITPVQDSKNYQILKNQIISENSLSCYPGSDSAFPDTDKSFRYTDYRGIDSIGTHKYLSETGWCFITHINSSEALEPIYISNIIRLILSFAGTVLFAFAGFLLSRNISRPIRELQQGTEIIGAGNLDYPIASNSRDEVGQLSRAIDLMTQNLKNTYKEIDNKVNEQTAEIIQKSKSLEDQQLAILNVMDDVKTHKTNYWELLENSQDGILVIDQAMNVIWGNKVILNMYEVNVDDIKGKSVVSFIAPESTQKAYDDIVEIFKGKNITGEYLTISPSGKQFWIEAHGRKTEFENRIVDFIQVRDITERKKANENLSASKSILQNIIDLLPVRIFWKDKKLVFQGCNTIFAQDAGKSSPAEIIGKDDYQMVWKEQADAYRKDDQSVIDTDQSKLDYEEEQTTPTGDKLWLVTNKIPLKNPDGTINGVLGTYMDITERKKSEIEIRRAKNYAENLIQTANAIVISLDPAGNITTFNKEAESITGFKVSEVIGRNYFEAICPISRFPEVNAQFVNLPKGTLPKKMENPIITKSGAERFISWQNSEIREGDKITGSISFGIDITDARQTQQKLKNSESQLYTALTFAHLGPWEYNIAEDKFTFNDSFYAIFRTTVDKVGGYTMSSEDYARRFVYPEDIPLVAAEVKATIEAADPEFTRQLEHRILYADGSVGYIVVRIFIVKDETGKTIKSFGINQDITDRKQAELALKSEKDKLQKYFEMMAIMVLIIDTKGEIMLINKQGAKLLGYTSGELFGKNWINDFVLKSPNPRPEKFLDEKYSDPENTVYFEHSIFNKQGREVKLAWGNTCILDEKNNVQAYLCAGEDITALKSAEVTITELRDFDRMKDEFLNIAAHELKTPLTSIIGLSEIIKAQKAKLPESMNLYPDIIYSEAVRLNKVVKKILTITRFESGKIIIKSDPVNLTDFITSLLPELEILANPKNVSILFNRPVQSVWVKSDVDQISEILINLVDNALKYGPENQTITINTSDNGNGFARIDVADQGQGIPKDSINRLFTKFSQLEPLVSRSQEGTGLGLYICKMIVEKLGGTIGLESEVDKGSVFFFTLPLNV